MDEVNDIVESTQTSKFDGRNAFVLGLALVAGFIAAASTRNEMNKVFNPKTNTTTQS